MVENKLVNIDSISAEVPDWSREKKAFFDWIPSKSLLASIRRYQHAKNKNTIFSHLVKKIAVLQHLFWSVITGAEIPINCSIGGGLVMPHANGIVIHRDTIIGPNCLIFHQVTLGSTTGNNPPIIGGQVDIGAGAKILGAITIGNHAKIGTNAVVLKDVPMHATAIGIPAKIILKNKSTTNTLTINKFIGSSILSTSSFQSKI